MEIILLLLLALLPCFILLFFIVYMDRNEREPLGQVLKVILLGAFSVVPAVFMEKWLGFLPIYAGHPVVSGIAQAFVQVAWVEELCKLGVVLLFAWNSKHFDEENDGIVYVGASALGFAMLENVFYVLDLGFSTGLLRAITAIPLHCFTGVLMGYYTGLAKFSPTPHQRRVNLFKGFFLAYMLHGLYDALLMTRTYAGILIFPLVLGLVFFGVRFLKKGRQLSLARSAEGVPIQTEVIPDLRAQQDVLVRVSPRNQLWKIVVSRTLFSICGLFWALIILGLLFKSDSLKEEGTSIILGSIILTFFPILIAFVLEVSYRQRRRLFAQLRQTTPEPESFRVYTGTKPVTDTILAAPAAILPSGLWWRAIMARTLLIICALLWALAILVVFARTPGEKQVGAQVLLLAFMITFFPIYIGLLLEDSYRKRKKRFSQLLPFYPNGRVPHEKLAISPPGQLWKIIISRFLFGIMVEVTTTLLIAGSVPETTLQTTPGQMFNDCLLVNTILLLIALPLELSYRKKKKAFLATQAEVSAAT